MSTIAEKLEYLDGTREKILTETNRLGVGLTEQDKFRDYAKGLHDGYVDLLNNGTDTLYDNMEKVSGSGSDITLENTEEAPMRSDLEGDTTQEGTPTPDSPQPINVVSGRQEVSVVGKNYFDNTIQPMISDNNITTSTIDTGKKLVWGGSSSSNYKFVVFAIMDLTNYAGKTIRFKCNFTASGSNIPQVNIGLCNADGSNRTSKASTKISGQTISFVVPTLVGEQKYLSLLLYINELGTLALNDYVEFTDMVLTIDNEDMTYEEYKGQSYEINLGKNLYYMNYNDTTNSNWNGVDITSTHTGYSVNGTATSNGAFTLVGRYITLEAGTYTMVLKNASAMKTGLTKTNYASIVRINAGQTSNTFTLSETTNVCLTIEITNGTEYDEENEVMICKGTDVGAFSPYKTPIELCKINDYKDRIYKENGTWYLHKEIGKVVLDGSESWEYYPITQGSLFRIRGFTGVKKDNNIVPLSNYYRGIPFSNISNRTNGDFYINANDSILDIINNSYTTTNDFKTWLSTHNTIVYYVLATPTTTEITDSELIEQLEEWYNQKSNKDTTYISVTSEDLPAILNVIAIKKYE